MVRSRAAWIAVAGAAVGTWLAVNAWSSGSLLRYRLAGFAVGCGLCLPLVTIATFRRRAVGFWRKVMFAAVPVLALLLLAEVGMRWLGPLRQPPMQLLVDDRLGHVVAPGTGGTDARGFRNDTASERCDVLVVGDSQTWGFGVDTESTFAARLAKATGLAVYQMANGSYGPVQYVELARRGLALQPRLLVVALYFGNDLVDAADYTGLAGAEPLGLQGVPPAVRDNAELHGLPAPNATMAVFDWLVDHSRVLEAAAEVVKGRLRGGVLDDQPGAVHFVDDRVATVLMPFYRMPAVDPAERRVREGIAVTGRCLGAIATAARAAGAEPLLLLIPTKEHAYAEWRGAALPVLAGLHEAEGQAHAAVIAAANTSGWRVVDMLAPLVAAMADGQPVWRHGSDGHLAEQGHRLAAELLAPHRPR